MPARWSRPARPRRSSPRRCHPYTQRPARLHPDPRQDPAAARSSARSPASCRRCIGPIDGCQFRNRCPHAFAACAAAPVPLRETAPGRAGRCLLRSVRRHAAPRCRSGRSCRMNEAAVDSDTVLECRGVGRDVRDRRRHVRDQQDAARRRRRRSRARSAARCWRSSARSGCGKTTLVAHDARACCRRPAARSCFGGKPIAIDRPHRDRAPRPAGVPGPLFLAQSAQDAGADHRPAARCARHRHARGAPRAASRS